MDGGAGYFAGGVTVLIYPGFSVFLLCYIIGSIPFGLILTKVFLNIDIRDTGSGNIGATNVLRTGNKTLAVATLLLDGSKGVIAILAILLLNPDFYDSLSPSPYQIDGINYNLYSIFCGLFAIIGHCCPIWLKFKGGKGVATTLGVLLAAVPYAGMLSCATWLLMAFLFKYSSLAALTAIGIAPVVTWLVYGEHPAFVCLLIAVVVWAAHSQNIKRLMKGEEPKIGAKKAAADSHREDAKTPSEL